MSHILLAISSMDEVEAQRTLLRSDTIIKALRTGQGLSLTEASDDTMAEKTT